MPHRDFVCPTFVPDVSSAWGVVPVSVLTVTWMNGGVRQTPLGHHSYTLAMASRFVVPLTLLAVTASACSGGGDAADTTPPTSIAPTTVEATTTTAAPTTSTPTTSTTTTVPATTAPTTPPTTPVPTVSGGDTVPTLPLFVPDGFTLEEVQAIDSDFREGLRLLYVALIDVNDEAAVQAALAYTTGDETEFVTSLVDSFRTNNRRLERLPEPPETFERLQGPTRRSDGDVGLSVCHVAPYRTVETAAGEADTVLNEGVVTQRTSVRVRLEDGRWKRSANFFDGQWRGVVRCQDVS